MGWYILQAVVFFAVAIPVALNFSAKEGAGAAGLFAVIAAFAVTEILSSEIRLQRQTAQ